MGQAIGGTDEFSKISCFSMMPPFCTRLHQGYCGLFPAKNTLADPSVFGICQPDPGKEQSSTQITPSML
jgi:hypothetical protein